jgi:hypothetical protein
MPATCRHGRLEARSTAASPLRHHRRTWISPFEWRDLASDACVALLAGLLGRSRPLREMLVR